MITWRLLGLKQAILILLLTGIATPSLADTSRLDAVLERGYVNCGVSRSGIGLSELSADGNWRGFFADFCRVLSAGVLGDRDAVEFVEITDVNRFEALNEGAIDVLMANTTWTVVRDSALGLAFTATVFYDGQGFLAYRQLGATTLAEVSEASVCVNRNTTTILNLQDLKATTKPGLKIVPFDAQETMYSAFLSRRCDMITYDRVVLRALQLYRASDPDGLILYPEVISKEPLGPAVVQGDPRWLDVVQWTVFATIAAEEMGLTSENIAARASEDQSEEVRRFLGVSGDIGPNLGLDRDWARRIVEQVGNYGEIYGRYLGGDGSQDRGLNALWMNGGMMYAPPFR